MNYNIIDRMKEANKKPEIQLDEEHTFKVNSSVPAVLKIQEISKKQKGNEGYSEIDGVYDIIAVALGKEAVEYIKSQEEYTFAALTLIVEAIMAALNNSALEEVEEQNKQAPSNK